MKVVLFYPRGYSLKNKTKKINSIACVMPPLGILSIAAYLRQASIDVVILDGALEAQVTNEEWCDRIMDLDPDFVGFSVTSAAFNDAYNLAEKLKSKNTKIETVFGGVHVSYNPERFIDAYPSIDYVIAGEGEQTLLDLVQRKTKKEIQGLVYREDNLTVMNPARDKFLELDELPFPAYDLLKGFPKKYLMPLFSYKKFPGVNIVSSRGCVYKCSFCDRSVFGASFRYNSPGYTLAMMKELYEKHSVRHFNFYDDLFTLNRKRVFEFCQLLIDSKMKISYNCIVRIGHIDKEMIKMLKRSGCWMVSVGIESSDQDLLNEHKEGLSINKIREDIKFLNKSGLWVKGLFMIGFPGETEESVKKTRELALSLPLKEANLTAFTPFPGAPISQEINKYGSFECDTDKMDCMNFVFIPDGLDKIILEKNYGLFYKKFYTRFFMFWKVYPRLVFESPHSFYRLFKNLFRFLSFARGL